MSAAVEQVTARTGSADSQRRRRLAVRGGILAVCSLYLAILLIGPLIGIVSKALEGGVGLIPETLTSPEVRHAFYLTGVITVQTLIVTTFFGVIVAWVLARHRFVGRRFMNALVDLPFAVSPVTVGLMAVLLFGTGGWFGDFFQARGIQILFALPSMTLVTIFICIPFVIREVQPVLEELGTEEEDAARTLGASSTRTFFRITLPNVRWALGYGIALSTARAIGEIGAVLIVSGAIKGTTETATIFVLTAFEERLDAQGNIVALTLAAVSVVLLVAIELFKRRGERLREEASHGD